MVYVKLIRESKEKTTYELLNLRHESCNGNGIDKIMLTSNFHSNYGGYMITQEDLERLFREKRNKSLEEQEKRKTEAEKKLEEDLKELELLREEKRKADKRFPMCIMNKFLDN